MPSASTSTLSRPSASRSSLSHWITVRSGMAAFSIGTSSASGPREMTKPPTCCDRWRGKPRSICGQLEHQAFEARAPDPRTRISSPGDRPLPRRKAERLAHVAHRALRPVADHRGGERGALAAVLAVDVLDHLLAPLVLEVDVDVGRLVALARHEALEQHAHARRIDLGDAERIAHHRVRRRAPPLAEDAAARGRSRTTSCTVRKNGS